MLCTALELLSLHDGLEEEPVRLLLLQELEVLVGRFDVSSLVSHEEVHLQLLQSAILQEFLIVEVSD